jgi:hypothetical protein
MVLFEQSMDRGALMRVARPLLEFQKEERLSIPGY